MEAYLRKHARIRRLQQVRKQEKEAAKRLRQKYKHAKKIEARKAQEQIDQYWEGKKNIAIARLQKKADSLARHVGQGQRSAEDLWKKLVVTAQRDKVSCAEAESRAEERYKDASLRARQEASKRTEMTRLRRVYRERAKQQADRVREQLALEAAKQKRRGLVQQVAESRPVTPVSCPNNNAPRVVRDTSITNKASPFAKQQPPRRDVQLLNEQLEAGRRRAVRRGVKAMEKVRAEQAEKQLAQALVSEEEAQRRQKLQAAIAKTDLLRRQLREEMSIKALLSTPPAEQPQALESAVKPQEVHEELEDESDASASDVSLPAPPEHAWVGAGAVPQGPLTNTYLPDRGTACAVEALGAPEFCAQASRFTSHQIKGLLRPLDRHKAAPPAVHAGEPEEVKEKEEGGESNSEGQSSSVAATGVEGGEESVQGLLEKQARQISELQQRLARAERGRVRFGERAEDEEKYENREEEGDEQEETENEEQEEEEDEEQEEEEEEKEAEEAQEACQGSVERHWEAAASLKDEETKNTEDDFPSQELEAKVRALIAEGASARPPHSESGVEGVGEANAIVEQQLADLSVDELLDSLLSIQLANLFPEDGRPATATSLGLGAMSSLASSDADGGSSSAGGSLASSDLEQLIKQHEVLLGPGAESDELASLLSYTCSSLSSRGFGGRNAYQGRLAVTGSSPSGFSESSLDSSFVSSSFENSTARRVSAVNSVSDTATDLSSSSSSGSPSTDCTTFSDSPDTSFSSTTSMTSLDTH